MRTELNNLRDHFEEAVDSECQVQLGKRQTNRQTTNNSHAVFNIPSLNSAISLNKSKILKSLLSKSLEEVNLCARPCSTQGVSTSEQLTQSDDGERYQFDEEMEILTPSMLGFQKLAQAGGAESAPPLNSAPLFPN